MSFTCNINVNADAGVAWLTSEIVAETILLLGSAGIIFESASDANNAVNEFMFGKSINSMDDWLEYKELKGLTTENSDWYKTGNYNPADVFYYQTKEIFNDTFEFWSDFNLSYFSNNVKTKVYESLNVVDTCIYDYNMIFEVTNLKDENNYFTEKRFVYSTSIPLVLKLKSSYESVLVTEDDSDNYSIGQYSLELFKSNGKLDYSSLNEISNKSSRYYKQDYMDDIRYKVRIIYSNYDIEYYNSDIIFYDSLYDDNFNVDKVALDPVTIPTQEEAISVTYQDILDVLDLLEEDERTGYNNVYENVTGDTYVDNSTVLNPSVEFPDNYVSTDYLDNVLAVPTADATTLDFTNFKELGVMMSSTFPFCLPWDLYSLLTDFNVKSKAPVWKIVFDEGLVGSAEIEINMNNFESLAKIVRYFILIIYCLGLIKLTRVVINS